MVIGLSESGDGSKGIDTMMLTSTAKDMLQIALEIPLNSNEAQKRGIPLSTNRLVIAKQDDATDTNVVLEMYTHIIRIWTQKGENLYIVPINAFLSAKAKRNLIDTLGLCELCVASESAFHCGSSEALRGILEQFDAEELSIFWATDVDIARTVLTAIAGYRGSGDSHNAPYLCTNTGREGFIFYASSHTSLEVMGNYHFVVERCLFSLFDQIWERHR